MSVQTKELVRRWADRGWNKRDASAIEDCFDEEFVGYDPYDGEVRGRAGVRGYLDAVHSGFSDFQIRVDDIVADGDLAYARYLCTGRHTGEFAGQAATGKELTFPAMGMWRLRNGRFIEARRQWGRFGLLAQLGANPFGEAPGAVADPGAGPETGSDVPVVEQERNKQTVRQWMDAAWHKRDFSAVDRLVAPDVRFWDSASPPVNGIEEFRVWAQGLDGAFNHFRIGVHDLISEGDKTAYRLTVEGEHTGDFHGCPPRGGKIDVQAVNIVRHQDGRMSEGWQIFDVYSLLEQITQPG